MYACMSDIYPRAVAKISFRRYMGQQRLSGWTLNLAPAYFNDRLKFTAQCSKTYAKIILLFTFIFTRIMMLSCGDDTQSWCQDVWHVPLVLLYNVHLIAWLAHWATLLEKFTSTLVQIFEYKIFFFFLGFLSHFNLQENGGSAYRWRMKMKKWKNKIF